MRRVDRTAPPSPAPSPPFRLPPIERAALPNGLRLCRLAHEGLPLVSVLLLIEAGASADRPDAHGLAAFAGDMLDEGSGARSALETHDALARLGAQLETEVGADTTILDLSVLSRHFDAGLQLLGDIAARPRLSGDDFERVRQLRLQRLLQLRNQPAVSADRAFLEHAYRGHPYGHLAIGSEAALRTLTVDDVAAFHAAHYRPDRATLIAVGDVGLDALVAAADAAFGGWTRDPAPPPPAIEAPANGARSLVVVPRAGAPQSELRIGHAGVPRSTPDFYALLVLNMALGGQFVSRVNLNLRERKGYTYGARTSFEFRRGPGPFMLQTAVQSSATADAVVEATGEIEAIRGPRPMTHDELDTAQAALTRGYARNFESSDQLARAALQLALHRLPDDYFDTFAGRVNAVTLDEVTAAAARRLDPSRLTTVIVGDPAATAALGEAEIVEL